MRRVSFSILIVVTVVVVFALRPRAAVAPNADGQPVYLATTCTPSWQRVPLTTVLDDVSRIAALPIDRSAISTGLGNQPVALVAIKPNTLGNTLTLLERCAPIRFIVNAGGIAVTAVDENASPHVETRRYLMSEYGIQAATEAAPLGNLMGLRDWAADSNQARASFIFEVADLL